MKEKQSTHRPYHTLYAINGQLEIYPDRVVIQHTNVTPKGAPTDVRCTIETIMFDDINDVRGFITDVPMDAHRKLVITPDARRSLFLIYRRQHADLVKEIMQRLEQLLAEYNGDTTAV